jgi:hypothetical protein
MSDVDCHALQFAPCRFFSTDDTVRRRAAVSTGETLMSTLWSKCIDALEHADRLVEAARKVEVPTGALDVLAERDLVVLQARPVATFSSTVWKQPVDHQMHVGHAAAHAHLLQFTCRRATSGIRRSGTCQKQMSGLTVGRASSLMTLIWTSASFTARISAIIWSTRLRNASDWHRTCGSGRAN